MTSRRLSPQLTAAAAALLVALAACTNSSGVKTQSISPTTSASPSSATTSAPLSSETTRSSTSTFTSSASTSPTNTQSLGSSSSNSAPSRSSTSSSTPPINSETVATSSNPWPSSFTAAQQKNSKSALDAFNGFVKVLTTAEKNPGKNWTTELRKYAADPTAATTLNQLASLAAAKVHSTITAVYKLPTVLSATDQKVVIQVCVDTTGAKIVDSFDKPVPLKPLAHPRSLFTYNVYRYDAKYGGWLVSETVASNPIKLC